MKKIKLLTLSFVFATFSAFAQNNFVVNEIRQNMSRGEQTGFEVPIAGGNPATVKSNFEKWLKGYKAKVSTAKGSPETFGDNALIKVVSQNTVDIYATTIPDANGARLFVYVDLGGAFISSANYPQQYVAMEALLKKFSQDQAFEMVNNQVIEEEKIAKNLSKEFETLKKDKDSYIKEIEKAKALIQQREQDITKNDADQLAKQQQINIQQQIIETLKQKRNSLK